MGEAAPTAPQRFAVVSISPDALSNNNNRKCDIEKENSIYLGGMTGVWTIHCVCACFDHLINSKYKWSENITHAGQNAFKLDLEQNGFFFQQTIKDIS